MADTEKKAPLPSDPRQEAWDAFLVRVRAQRRDPAIFDEQKALGEFDKIPDSFIG